MMFKSLAVLHSEKECDYRGIVDQCGIVGDCVYKTDRTGWWDYAYTGYFLGEIPTTFRELLNHVDNKDKVVKWFEEFPTINIIACYCYGSQGAEPMIRFYEKIVDIAPVEDEHEEIYFNRTSNHGYEVIRDSKLKYTSEYSLPEVEYDEDHKFNDEYPPPPELMEKYRYDCKQS